VTGAASYRIYFGTASGDYDQMSDAGNVTTSIVPGLNSNTTYYFVVTALDASDRESSSSNEVTKAIP
jgi:hypothetical protein